MNSIIHRMEFKYFFDYYRLTSLQDTQMILGNIDKINVEFFGVFCESLLSAKRWRIYFKIPRRRWDAYIYAYKLLLMDETLESQDFYIADPMYDFITLRKLLYDFDDFIIEIRPTIFLKYICRYDYHNILTTKKNDNQESIKVKMADKIVYFYYLKN